MYNKEKEQNMKTKEEITALTQQMAFDIMTSPGTKLTVEEAISHWEAVNVGHPGILLWHPFEHLDNDSLLEVFDMFVSAFEDFAKDLGA